MSTAAKPQSQDSSHWYHADGSPCYELPKKDGSGMKVPTLADARKLNLLPSVTTILKCLHKEALVKWLIEQACLAVLTSPRLPEESLDAFVYRVLQTERVQDQESTMARDRGTQIHNAMEQLFQGQVPDAEILPWVEPAYREIAQRGDVVALEQSLASDCYAGRIDLQLRSHSTFWLIDWKTTKKIPRKDAYIEAQLQLAAYAKMVEARVDCEIRTANVYISTIELGAFKVCENPDWRPAFENGFLPVLKTWQYLNDYCPAPANFGAGGISARETLFTASPIPRPIFRGGQ